MNWHLLRLTRDIFCLKDLDDFVEAALLFYSGKNILDGSPLPLRLEKDNDPRLVTSPLKFPGKLAIDILNNRLFISDSNHNRIVGSLSYILMLFKSLFSTVFFNLKHFIDIMKRNKCLKIQTSKRSENENLNYFIDIMKN